MPIGTNKMLSSNYLSGVDVEPFVNATVHSVTEEEVGRDKEVKTVVWFDEFDKGLVCNKTNLRNLINLLGKSEDVNADWKGKQVQLYATNQEFGGEEYNVVRVRAVQPAGRGNGTPKPISTEEPAPVYGLTVAGFAAKVKSLFGASMAPAVVTEKITAASAFLGFSSSWRDLTDEQRKKLFHQVESNEIAF